MCDSSVLALVTALPRHHSSCSPRAAHSPARFCRRFNSVMIGALGSSLFRAAPATHASLFRPLPMAAPHAARGIAAAALPHRIAVRRAPLARLLSGEADRTVVEKATTLIKKALSPKEVKIQVCVPASPLRGRRVHRRQALC